MQLLTKRLLVLWAAMLLPGWTERGVLIQGTRGPVAWQVTDRRVVERAVAGAPCDRAAAMRELTGPQDATCTGTLMDWRMAPPGDSPVGVSQPVASHWQLPALGAERPAVASWGSWRRIGGGAVRILPPAGASPLLQAGIEARGQPVRVAMDVQVSQNPLRPTRAPSSGPPAGSPLHPAPAPGGAAGLMPFQLVDNLILVDAVLNRQASVTLLLDTGATETFLTPETATRIGLWPPANAPTRTASGIGGHQVVFPLVQLATITVGDAVMANLEVGILASFRTAPPVDGILGGSFLHQFTLTLDYATRRLRLAAPDTSRPAPAPSAVAPEWVRRAVPIQIVGTRVLVRAVLNRKDPVTLLLDTGATQTILTPDTATRVGLRPPANAPSWAPRMAEVPLHGVPFVLLSALSVGEARVANLLVGVASFSPRVLAVDGLLGGDFLTQFTLTLDRATHQLWLESPHLGRP